MFEVRKISFPLKQCLEIKGNGGLIQCDNKKEVDKTWRECRIMIKKLGEIKANIEMLLNDMRLNEALEEIETYKRMHPEDMDLLSYYCVYYLYSEDGERALKYAELGVRKYPTSADMHYNLACVYEYLNDFCNSIKHYCMAGFFYKEYKYDSQNIIEKLQSKIDLLVDLVKKENEIDLQTDDTGIIRNEDLDELFSYERDLWGITGNVQSLDCKSIGNYLFVGTKEKRYIGYLGKQLDGVYGEADYNLMKMKGEFLKVSYGTNIKIPRNGEYLLPIATDKENTVHNFFNPHEDIMVIQKRNRHFNYYRIAGNTTVVSSTKCYYGKPIPLEHDSNRKKLVLNIFVDGLTQEVLGVENGEFERLMPNTWRFFQKGVICTQAYSTAEWTYPTLASFVSGLDVLNHKLFHSSYNTILPEDIPLLYEYFSEAGYYTAKIDGEWRSSPYLGYGRGLDRYVYQIQTHGSRTEQEFGDVLEHMEAFRETDQFLWVCFGDLHDIADGFDLNTAVQTKIPVSLMSYEEDGISSVKQNFSQNKINIYKEKVKYIDSYLGILYAFIESHYQDDEILISLFGDHGQGYFVPEGEHFLSKERSKIAFMFRGCGKTGRCDELISPTDYTSIMCKLAGISMRKAKIQGQLPKFFGGENERNYVITESLHPGDPYQAAIHTKEFTVFFTNGDLVRDDGRFCLKDEVIFGKTKSGEFLKDNIILEKYYKIFIKRIAHLLIY